MQHLAIRCLRGTYEESAHPIAAIALDATGHELLRIGPATVTTWRSAAKPFQLAASLSCLSSTLRDQLTTQELAIGAASHSAQPDHIDCLNQLIDKLGVDAKDLQCGTHAPIHLESAHTLLRKNQTPTPLHNNCSGKHLFMLAAANGLNQKAKGYLQIEHPVQQVISKAIAQQTKQGVIDTVIDGCGVPCFVLPLQAMALAWTTLAVATHRHEGPLGIIGNAMLKEPFFVSGTKRLDLRLAQVTRGSLITKVGAAGLLCGAIPAKGVGFVIKVLTGEDRVRAAAAIAILHRLYPGLAPVQAFEDSHTLFNLSGKTVGRYLAHWHTP